MTMTSEELKIKVKIDTSGIESGAAKIKSSLRGIEDAAGGMSGATGEASASFVELQESMESIRRLEFAQLLSQHSEALTTFTKNITNAFTNVSKCMKDFRAKQKKESAYMKGYIQAAYGLEDSDISLRDKLSIKINEIKNLKNQLKDCAENGIGAVRAETARLKTEFSTTIKAAKLLMLALVPVAGIMSSFSASALGKEIYNTAQRVGMGTAAYQEWKYIIEQTGGDITDLIGAQQTLTEAQIDVAEGAEDIIAAFKHIGLSAEEVMAMDRQELFERTIAGLQNIENSTERAAVGYKLLSEDSSTLAALLGMSNEQTRQLANNYQYLGAIMSQELIGKSLQFQGALSNLRAAFQGLTNTLAEIFLPVLTTVINAIAKVMAMANMLIRTLFGLELTTSESGTSSVVGSGINGFGALTDSIEEAEKEAQKLRRTLMGFDELNVLEGTAAVSSPAAGAGASASPELGGGMGNVGGGLFNPDNLNLDTWHERFNEWASLIQTFVPIAMIGIGAVGAVWCALSGNWIGALAFATMAGIGLAAADSAGSWGQLATFFEKHNLSLVPIAMIGLGAVGAVMCALSGNWIGAMAFAAMAGIGLATVTAGDGFSLESIQGVFEELKNYAIPIILLAGAIIAGMMGNLPVAAGLLAGAGLSGYLTWTGEGSMWDGIVKVVDDILPELKKYAIPIIALAGAIAAALMGNLPAAGVLLGIAAVTNFMTFSTDGGVWTGLLTTLKGVWENIVKWFKENVGPKFTKEYWATKFNTIKEGLSTKLGEAKTAITDSWESTTTYFKTNIAPKFTPSYWSNKFDGIKQGISTKLDEAKTTIKTAWENIKKYFKGNIAMSFTKSFWATKFGTIKDGAKQALNGVIDVVEKAVNAIISKLNTLSWSIPDWVPKVGGKKFGFNIKQVKIPRLAEGGIATASTLANIGENGREAVLPLDHNTEWMDALADKIASRSQGPTKLVLKVGEKELGWASIKGINQITRQTGELQLVL